jgi:hypothetical protein
VISGDTQITVQEFSSLTVDGSSVVVVEGGDSIVVKPDAGMIFGVEVGRSGQDGRDGQPGPATLESFTTDDLSEGNQNFYREPRKIERDPVSFP